MNKLTLHITGACFALLLIGPLTFMALDRDPPYAFTNTAIVPPEVRQGEDFAIWFETKTLRNHCSEGLVYREYVDANGLIRRYDPILRKRPPDVQNGKFVRYGRIPMDFPPGPTIYRGEACYPCNPLQRWAHWPVCIKAPEVMFTVLEAPGGTPASKTTGDPLLNNDPEAQRANQRR